MRLLVVGEVEMVGENVFNDLDQLDDQIQKEIVAKVAATGLDYANAMRAVTRENPALVRLREVRYRERERATIGLTTWRLIDGKLVEIDNQVESLTREAQKAHPDLGYREALRLVASENRELFRLREQVWRVLHG